MDKQEWIKTLKVGDEVAIRSYQRWGGSPYSLTMINKITPTGRLKLDNGLEFNADGSMRGGDTWTISSDIEPVTDDVLSVIHKYKLVSSVEKGLDRFKWQAVEEDDLEIVLGILNKYK